VDFAVSTDDQLARAASTGDDDAFAELVRRHKGKVFGIASRFARGDHSLEDLCQEIFIRAYRRLAQFRGEAPFEHWLSRIAVRCCYDFLRKKQPEHVTLDEWKGESSMPNQALERIELALAKLSPDQRLVITLLELEERSVREVAALTKWSESAVKVRAFRARKALKQILERTSE
jgi:RNA polymerase sigma-70 factor (ECF subfamily)